MLTVEFGFVAIQNLLLRDEMTCVCGCRPLTGCDTASLLEKPLVPQTEGDVDVLLSFL